MLSGGLRSCERVFQWPLNATKLAIAVKRTPSAAFAAWCTRHRPRWDLKPSPACLSFVPQSRGGRDFNGVVRIQPILDLRSVAASTTITFFRGSLELDTDSAKLLNPSLRFDKITLTCPPNDVHTDSSFQRCRSFKAELIKYSLLISAPQDICLVVDCPSPQLTPISIL